jgi:hypothetical protein
MSHHHHKRGSDCEHRKWATSDDAGHHHHKRGNNCIHGLWATDSVGGHHHHKRGGDCVEHRRWATSEDVADRGALTGTGVALTEAEFSDDPSIQYDLSQSDSRPCEEVEAELETQAG